MSSFSITDEPGTVIPNRGASDVQIGQAIAALLKVKRLVNLRRESVTGLRQYLSQFSRGRESWPLSRFSVDVIEDWFLSRNESSSTQASNVGRLSSLFSYAVRRRWLLENPCDLLEKVRIDRKPPPILKPHQCAMIMDWCRREKPHRAAFFALAIYAGIRPHELARLTWDAVNVEDGTVTIDAAASKVRRRRIVELEPMAIQWLAWAKEHGGRLPVSRETRRRYLDDASELLGLDAWPQDCMRHSAASYLLALHKNAALTAYRLGNSVKVLETNYKALVRSGECREFWAFLPDSPLPNAPQPLSSAEAPLVTAWGVSIDPRWSRFARAEAALAAEPAIRAKARRKQRDDGYAGAVLGWRSVDRLDTVGELGRIAGCSRRTIAQVKAIIRNADADTLQALRSGKPGFSIAGTYKRIKGETASQAV